MKSQLDELQIPFEFWQGVRGNRLAPQALIHSKAVTEAFFSADQGKTHINLAQAGCALSHWRLWQYYSEQMASSGKPILILEDDAFLDPDFSARLSDVSDDMPNDTDILYLGYTAEQKNGLEIKPGLREARFPRGNFGYLVWPKGLEKLLSMVFPISMPFDEVLARLISRKQLSACLADPELIAHKPDFKSTIWFPKV